MENASVMTAQLERLFGYFPELDNDQRRKIEMLGTLYSDWNAKINVISRKDIDNLYEHHVLHSMGITKMLHFKPGSSVMDIGTGGGFPGIPLAIMFPDVHFHLLDSIGKKVKVAAAVAESLGLKNVSTIQCRAEEEKGKFDFVVSRAVLPLIDLTRLIKKNIKKEQINAMGNGLIALKGGELDKEVFTFRHTAVIVELKDYFKEEYFQTKKVVYIPL